jgi:hypothetical protein
MKVINLKNKIGCMCVVILALFVGVVLYNRYFNNIVKSLPANQNVSNNLPLKTMEQNRLFCVKNCEGKVNYEQCIQYCEQ